MKNTIVKGTFLLLLGGVLNKILGALYRIPLSNILGADGIGIYQLIYPVYSLLIVFVTGGLGVVISKKVSGLRANGKHSEIYQTLKQSFKICLVYGIVVGGALLLLSFPIAYIQGNLGAILGYIVISLAIVFSCLLSVFRGYFQGYQNMVPTVISQLIEQTSKFAVGLILAILLLPYGLSYAVAGAVMGVVVSEIICFVYLLIKYNKCKPKKYTQISITSRQIILEALPISIGNIIMPLFLTIESFIVVNLLKINGFTPNYSISLFGVYSGMIMPIVNIPITLMSALSTSMLPGLAYNNSKKINNQTTICMGFKFLWVFVLPCVFGLILLAPNIILVLYPGLFGNMFEVAQNLLIFMSVSIIFLCIIQYTTTLLQSYNHVKYPTYTLLIGCLIKLVLGIVLLLMPTINILGMAISGCVGFAICAILNIVKVKNLVELSLSPKEAVMPIICCFLMSFVVIGALKITSFMGIFVSTFMSVCAGAFIYVLLIFLFKVFDIKKIMIAIRAK